MVFIFFYWAPIVKNTVLLNNSPIIRLSKFTNKSGLLYQRGGDRLRNMAAIRSLTLKQFKK
ncbi:hypothetical protein NQ315_002968 [Exocentrus adspersus]|uniref:Uncharacterized protein n=1 Tax=Exocentrus adspersus TaxID=1586481 RepID=A0AAV8W3X1_9CUCU|nr:hypothetical protein NQ315_002968 [Exocentrus adspersus]